MVLGAYLFSSGHVFDCDIAIQHWALLWKTGLFEEGILVSEDLFSALVSLDE